ncbi:TetR/AcrR family transcriptional regulator [Brachybacterium sp. Z12]|uniref:TetR/AcrR family transcriptional regulator n=1 Tax=Brachybacterium sp. Z12 TaxID=2759167 RepID=UPI00223B50E5|nr:TetR/AcrR family transcriptional regulator [Brachybacterium sp. Z12]
MASDTQHAPARPAHRPSAREAMLDAAEAHLGAGGTLTLDSAARAAEVSKPGLMYHFATKEQLLTAVLDRITARYEQGMAQAMTATADAVFADATATQRFLAYFDWAGQALLTPADLVIFADPKLRVALTERWQEQVDRWLHVPAGTTADRRRRLLAVRLMADGLWFDRASGLLVTSAAEAVTLRGLAAELLDGAA